MENIYTVIITAITVLGSTKAWDFYSKKLEKKREFELEYKWDCRDRISKLEALLEESSREKNELRETVLQLTQEVASLRTRVELLSKKQS
jgi:hypothetical protein